MSTATDNRGYLPTHISPATQSTQDSMSQYSMPDTKTGNYIYIYSFLVTLFSLLCIALIVLLRALVRRRRLEAQLARFDSEPTTGEQTATRRRRKKRKDYGEKPGFVDAWIGDGPLPTSLSTEALLEVIQPFSAAREPISTDHLRLTEKSVQNTLEPPMDQDYKLNHLLPVPLAPSASSCSHSDDLRASSPPPSPPPPSSSTPSIHEVETIKVGFLIAMPRPPPIPSFRKGASASTSTLSIPNKDTDTDSFWSLAESKWSDHLAEGELPELTVGVSTLYIPVERSRP